MDACAYAVPCSLSMEVEQVESAKAKLVADLAGRLSIADAQAAQLRQRLDTLQAQNSDAHVRASAAVATVHEAERDAEETRNRVEVARQEAEVARAQAALYKQEAASAHADVAKLREALAQAEQYISSMITATGGSSESTPPTAAAHAPAHIHVAAPSSPLASSREHGLESVRSPVVAALAQDFANLMRNGTLEPHSDESPSRTQPMQPAVAWDVPVSHDINRTSAAYSTNAHARNAAFASSLRSLSASRRPRLEGDAARGVGAMVDAASTLQSG
ncbi:hypothetical protein EON66_08865, partial [archaeon]